MRKREQIRAAKHITTRIAETIPVFLRAGQPVTLVPRGVRPSNVMPEGIEHGEVADGGEGPGESMSTGAQKRSIRGAATNDRMRTRLISGCVALVAAGVVTRHSEARQEVAVGAGTSAAQSIERNVIYGMVSGAALLMDVHRSTALNGLGVFYLGGGGWASAPEYSATGLKDTAHMPLVSALTRAGYTVFAINYRSTPAFSYPDPVEDVQRAVRFVRHHATRFGVDPNRLGGFGGSAGGHLVALTALKGEGGVKDDAEPINRESTRLQAVAVVAAPTDLLESDAAGAGAVGAFMRMRPPAANAAANSMAVRLYRDASPITHVSADDPPTLLVHGDADRSVALRQSVAFNAALQRVGVPSKLLVVPGGEHGATFGLAEGASRPANWPDYIDEIVQWFHRYLRP